jgi:hypothetical protein
MTNTYLEPSEIRDLTGCAHRQRQEAWLKANNWPYAVAATGHIRVLRSYWHDRMSGAKSTAPTVHAGTRHNFSAIAT